MRYRFRRFLAVVLLAGIAGYYAAQNFQVHDTSGQASSQSTPPTSPATTGANRLIALDVLGTLDVKGRAPKTGYARAQFGQGWTSIGQCDMRNVILNRDLSDVTLSNCVVMSGALLDPYSGTTISFMRGPTTSDAVEIDHVVALSNAWQTGAQLLDAQTRVLFANDPLELIAVGRDANQAKSDGDAATWLPLNKTFRCQYVARQIGVKAKYHLWVTVAEKDAMMRVLSTCPDQLTPSE